MLKISLAVAIALTVSLEASAQPLQHHDVIVVLRGDERPGGIRGAAARASHAANRAEAGAVAQAHGLSATQTYGTALRGFAARANDRQLDALRSDSRVARVEFDGIAYGTQAGPGGGGEPSPQQVPWGIERVGAVGLGNTGVGIHVYVLDSGIDSDHPDLAAHLGNGWAGYDCKGNSCIEVWDDDYGHGTHVSGTIGALDNAIHVVGVAPGVTLHPVKVLHKSNSGAWSVIAAGVDWAAAEMSARGEVAVANMSLGGIATKSGTCSDTGFTGTGVLHEAMCNAKNLGLVIAVAAGNSGADSEGEIPASFDDAAIIVSATFEGDDWIDWSNWGDEAAAWTPNDSAPVAIAAPGISVVSTWNDGGLNTISGTSMATPHVSGAVALYLANNPFPTDASAFHNVRAALLATAESTLGFNNTSGHPHSEDFLDVGAMGTSLPEVPIPAFPPGALSLSGAALLLTAGFLLGRSRVASR